LCDMCPPGTFSLSDVRAYREATTKTYRGVGTVFDPTAGASRCAPCPAGTYQPDSGGRSQEECRECPPGQFRQGRTFPTQLVPPVAIAHTRRAEGRLTSSLTVQTDYGDCCPYIVQYIAIHETDTFGVNRASAGGSAACDSCPGGTYQPFARQTSVHACLPCAAGTCSDTEGSEECYQVRKYHPPNNPGRLFVVPHLRLQYQHTTQVHCLYRSW
jgi:hypothetical protein